MSDPNAPQHPQSPQDPQGTPPAYGSPSPDPQQPPAYGQQPPAYGQQPPQYGQQPPAYGGAPGYGQPSSYPQAPSAGGYGAPSNTEANQLGVWSLVLGIVSIVCLGFIAGIPAIILGSKSKRAVAEGRANNAGMGTAGIVLGWIGTIFAILSIVWIVFMIGSGRLDDLAELNDLFNP